MRPMLPPDEDAGRARPVEVPPAELSAAALRGLAESFVLREGTDYGERDVPFEVKVGQVLGQLERGEARILYDPASESVQIVTRAALRAVLPDAVE